ncbi:methyltransferase [Devosia chinhatensis]|uniref:methyltransferase n=1 Tax=Devosia chinhatensis TaxID=429727 RepID=UPI001364B121|nr:methyltransferase [Devosia chinhatensis]
MPANPVLALRARELLAESEALIKARKVAEAVRASVELVNIAPELPEAHRLMGSLAMTTSAPEIAVGSFERALALKPGSEGLHLDLGQALMAAGETVKARDILLKGLALNAANGKLLRELGQAQLQLGDRDGALKSFRRARKTLPDDHFTAHMVGALSQPGTTNDAYVADLFDKYAGHFEAHLTGKLQYRVPQALADLLRETGRPLGAALDIGCGTGLVGAALGASASAIDGIDLAPRMVEKTRETGFYRNLAVGEAARTLATEADFAGPYDTAVAADVFIYVGAIETLFAAIVARLAPEGLFAFSIETADRDDVEIRASGRFAHSAAYIERLAKTHDLIVLRRQDHDIRLEDNRPIKGALYILARDR